MHQDFRGSILFWEKIQCKIKWWQDQKIDQKIEVCIINDIYKQDIWKMSECKKIIVAAIKYHYNMSY